MKSNRRYAFISSINQSLVHARQTDELLHQTCDLAMRVGGFRAAYMAWIDPTGKLVYGGVRGNKQMVKYLMDHTGINIKNENYAGTLSGRVFRTGRTAISNEVMRDSGLQQWQLLFMQCGIGSGIAIPLKQFGKVIGVFGFYAEKNNYFDLEETSLLEKVVSDVAFALEAMHHEEQRRLAEMQLAQSEARLKRAQRMANIGHWERNLGTGILLWSEEMRNIYGVTDGNMYYTVEKWLQHLHPDDCDAVRETIATADNTHQDIQIAYRIIRPDGEVRHLRSEGKYELDESGHPLAIYGVVQDVTDRKRDEAQLLKSQANLSAIIENTDALIYSIDREFRYITFNSQLQQTIKRVYDIDIQTGDVVFDFLRQSAPEEVLLWEEMYNQAFAGKSQQFEKEHLVDGRRAYTSFSVHPIWEGHTVIGLSCFVRDITEKKMAEEQLRLFQADEGTMQHSTFLPIQKTR